jgi:hypothetical protein
VTEWGLIGTGAIIEDAGTVTSDSAGTAVASDAAADTKGGWQQLIASTARDSHGILINLGPDPDASPAMVDIGVGANPNQSVIIADLYTPQFPEPGVVSYYFPIYIGAAQTVSARCAGQFNTPAALDVSVHLIAFEGLALPPYTFVDAYTDTANTEGFSVDPGSSANTKPSTFTQLSASVNEIRQLYIGMGQANATMGVNEAWLLDIAIGAASSETVVVPNLRFACDSGKDTILPQNIGPIPIHIPAGERLSARAQSTETTAADRPIFISAFGVR